MNLEIKYLSGFEIKYQKYGIKYQLLFNDYFYITKVTINSWDSMYEYAHQCDDSLYINNESNFLEYKTSLVLITDEVKDKMIKYYTYMRRKKIIEKLGI